MPETIALPILDQLGNLNPLVLEAVAAGATAALDPSDPHATLVLSFGGARAGIPHGAASPVTSFADAHKVAANATPVSHA